MRDFDLLLPESVTEVVTLLARHKDKSAILAGGTDLLVALKFDYAIDNVISLALVPGLGTLRFDPQDGLVIGAKVTVAEILKSAEVKANYPALWQAAQVFATPQLRNTATVLGNIMRASPAGDCSLAILALGGTVLLQSTAGQREVDLDNFWLSYAVTARQDDELAIAVKIPAPPSGQKSAFRRMTRTTEDLSKLGAAVSLHMAGNVCQQARVAMGCVGPTLVRLPAIEKILAGAKVTTELLQDIVGSVAAEINPIDDQRSSADYRLKVAGVLVRRVIEQALDNEGNVQ
ncbi:MAG: xanthine dehydrogenase family protein subunit M [Alphaproteobacteria bacterium]|nr:xanthine dehydrogenase family protein subunit M [Alphaproteobacteria bacterium]